MIKKLLSIVIIISMILHCSSRLGVISFLYKSRYDIAASIGIIKEKPIASCDSHYFAEKDFKIIDNAGEDTSENLIQALEINLAQPSIVSFTFESPFLRLCKMSFPIQTGLTISYCTNIFHPPLS
jgi:hypothetical protein